MDQGEQAQIHDTCREPEKELATLSNCARITVPGPPGRAGSGGSAGCTASWVPSLSGALCPAEHCRIGNILLPAQV